MSQTEATRQSDWIRPPRAALMSNSAVTTAASSLDLSTVGYTTPNMALMDQEPAPATSTAYGLIGHYITIYADGVDLGVIFSGTQAAVTGANAPVLATTGVNAAGVCYRIPAGQERTYKITPNDRWIGVVASGTGNMRIFQSSP